MLILFALLFSCVAAQPATFNLYFGCNFPNNGTNIMGVSITVCANQPNYIQTVVPSGPCQAGNNFIVTLQTSAIFTTLQDCTVTVSENQLTASRTFQILPGQTYNWLDLTADLTVNIEDWNPWCAVSPDPNELGYNGGRVGLQVQLPTDSAPSVFRGYSPYRSQCDSTSRRDLRWTDFPLLADGNFFGNATNPNACTSAGSFHRPVVVGILRTSNPITVYAEEFRFTSSTPDACLEPRVFTVGRTAIGYPTSAQNPGAFVQYNQDTNCGDGSCNSGLLIARLQMENRCWENQFSAQAGQTPLQIAGRPLGAQDAYNVTFPDGSVALRSFPMGGMLLAWDFPSGGTRNVRYEVLPSESTIAYYILATDNYQPYAQYDVNFGGAYPLTFRSYNATVDFNTAISGRFVKQPTAACGMGSCDGKPITSSLYIDTQGFCDQIDSISIVQQTYNVNSQSLAVQNHRPNCTSLFNGRSLIYCVWNLDRTDVLINYKTTGTMGSIIPVDTTPGTTIDCQEGIQRCDSPGGLVPFCPNLGCLTDALNGPTQLNFATWSDNGASWPANSRTLLNYFQASPQTVKNTNNGCWWVPRLSNLRLTISEGCCSLNKTAITSTLPSYNLGQPAFNLWNNPRVFSGFGCVEFSSDLTDCSTSTLTTCTPRIASTTANDFGRTLAAFDLAYMPQDDGISTVSVSLESDSDCGPFRFKTSQGGAPRCYCVLPIWVRGRIIETNLHTNVQACKCANRESCVVRYNALDQDCSLCDWASQLNFDLRGLPRSVTANLWVGPWSGTGLPTTTGHGILRQFSRGVGGELNRLTVLQNGIQESGCVSPQNCPLQAYCVQVTENAATLIICVACDFKVCTAYDFTRDLCLDLQNPCANGTTSQLFDVVLTTNGLTVNLENDNTWSHRNNAPTQADFPGRLAEFVRTVPGQGGFNGCSSNPTFDKREIDVVEHSEALTEESMSAMTEEDLIDLELTSTMRNIEKDETVAAHKRQLGASNPGHYTVLRLPNYGVTLFEQNVRVQRQVNCDGTTLTSCSTTNTGLGYLNCLCWNSTCVGNAVNQQSGINGGSIPSNNIWITLGGNGELTFGEDDVRRRQPAFHQVRGPRGYWTQNLTTCEWTKLTWINATWQRAGNQVQCVPVLQSNMYSLTVEEGLLFPPAPIWPDPRGHPLVTVQAACEFNLTAFPSCSQRNIDPNCRCYVRSNQIFALWQITTLQPLLSELGSNLVFTYTGENSTNYAFSNQNVFRVIPSNSVAWGNAQQGTGSQLGQVLWQPADNYFCQVADPRYSFTFTWASTYNYPSQVFPAGAVPRSSDGVPLWDPQYGFTPFNCNTETLSRWTGRFSWAGGDTFPLNLCRGCQWRRLDFNSFDFPPPPLLIFNPRTDQTNYNFLTPPPTAGSWNSETNQCRFALVQPSSNFYPSLPLGQIFSIPFAP